MDSQPQSGEPIGEAWKLDPEYHKVSDFLGVNVYDRNDFELAKKVYALKDWAGGKTINDTLWKMRGLQKELGHQFIGKPLITEMYKYIRLKSDHDRESLPLESTTIRSPKPETKPQAKPQVKTTGTLQKAVSETVNQAVKGMVNQVLSDKKVIQGAVETAIKEALK